MKGKLLYQCRYCRKTIEVGETKVYDLQGARVVSLEGDAPQVVTHECYPTTRAIADLIGIRLEEEPKQE